MLALAASAEVAKGADEVRSSAAFLSIHAMREPGHLGTLFSALMLNQLN
jgi:hypothetical protein